MAVTSSKRDVTIDLQQLLADCAAVNGGTELLVGAPIPAEKVAYTFLVSGLPIGTYVFPTEVEAATVMDQLRSSAFGRCSMHKVYSLH